MDYETATDFEINIAVAEGLGAYGFCGLWGDVLVKNTPFDPCNSWADAGPIIVKNKINITFGADLCGSQTLHNNKFIESVDKNPLRAAMIVFLKMKEAE